jgi:hypothetical protein
MEVRWSFGNVFPSSHFDRKHIPPELAAAAGRRSLAFRLPPFAFSSTP